MEGFEQRGLGLGPFSACQRAAHDVIIRSLFFLDSCRRVTLAARRTPQLGLG